MTQQPQDHQRRRALIAGAATLADFVDSLASPRKVMVMVKAGAAVEHIYLAPPVLA